MNTRRGPESLPSSLPSAAGPTRRPAAGVDRRSFLRYVGYGVGGLAASRALGPLARAAAADVPAAAGAAGDKAAPSGIAPAADPLAWAAADGSPAWTPVPYPVPIPGDGGCAHTDPARLAAYNVSDDLLLPAGFRYAVIARWGDVYGPAGHADRRVKVGYNCDYTGLTPVRGGTAGESWLFVNHEYISARPWVQGAKEVHGHSVADEATGTIGEVVLEKTSLNLLDEAVVKGLSDAARDGLRKFCTLAMDDLGVTVLRVRRADDGTVAVVADADDHLRVTGNPKQPAPAGGWRFTGPAASLFDRPTGTFANCSGATTPWGTFLTCEENYQDQVPEFIAPDGAPLKGDRKPFGPQDDGISGSRHPTHLPYEFYGLGTFTDPPLDGRAFGWVCEVDPHGRSLAKHTALGRFRHENVALRVEAGKPLAAYLGDDRRGGHVWKFVSDDLVKDPADPMNSRLFERGTLYVARMNADYTGEWVALRPDAPLRRPQPEFTASGHLYVPRRPDGGHAAVAAAKDDKNPDRVPVADWVKSVEEWARAPFDKLTLADLVAPGRRGEAMAVILTDAYAMANAVGGTPTARPEDIEIHPADRSIYISFTDSTGSAGEGSPDARAFPDSAGKNSRQYGAIYRIAEDADDPAARTFTWGRFVPSGEAADGGGGFACADNLVFDPAGNLWMVCDITTPAHNFPVDRVGDKVKPGDKFFPGVFGNNAMFMIPTRGPHAGVPFCFGIGPMECELTGPTWVPAPPVSGNDAGDAGPTLIVSVQHPGELHGTHCRPGVSQSRRVSRTMRVAARDGTVFTQRRSVPLGSNWPGGKPGELPRPAVVCITRTP